MEKEDHLKMTEKESLELIASMINKAKNRVNETGVMYLRWGWLILICCIVQFSAIHFFKYTQGYYIWFSTWLFLFYQLFFPDKHKKRFKVKTYTDEINMYVWIVFFICLILVIFIGIHFNRYEMIYPLILAMYGMPIFLSGIILKFKPLKIGGTICWLLSIISVFIVGDYQSLFIAAAIIVAWIIPGYLLKKNYKKVNNAV
ncbi:MAG: hypothetical protein Q8891_17850 [Bacteroidota bacterium]|nr:hypothetical protein [Bacteroidota bacterium]